LKRPRALILFPERKLLTETRIYCNRDKKEKKNMMDDDESDEMEQDLEIDEFFDKIKFFKAKSGKIFDFSRFCEK